MNCVLHSVFAVLATLGNTSVLVAIWRTPPLHSPSNTLLASLALSDLAVGTIVQLSYLPYKLAELCKNVDVICELSVLFNISGFFLSILSCLIVTAISVERYLAIHLHLRYQELVTIGRVLVAILLAVLVAVTATILVIWYEVMFLVTGMVILLCLLVTLFVNSRMISNLGYHLRQIRNLELSVKRRKNFNTGSNCHFSVITYRKSVFTISYVVAAMLLCYLPYLCSILARSLVEYPNNTVRLALNVTHMITFANSAWNPVLYCWRIREIRRAILQIFLCKNPSLS